MFDCSRSTCAKICPVSASLSGWILHDAKVLQKFVVTPWQPWNGVQPGHLQEQEYDKKVFAFPVVSAAGAVDIVCIGSYIAKRRKILARSMNEVIFLPLTRRRLPTFQAFATTFTHPIMAKY